MVAYTAVAHTLARMAYFMLTGDKTSSIPGSSVTKSSNLRAALERRATALGFAITSKNTPGVRVCSERPMRNEMSFFTVTGEALGRAAAFPMLRQIRGRITSFLHILAF